MINKIVEIDVQHPSGNSGSYRVKVSKIDELGIWGTFVILSGYEYHLGKNGTHVFDQGLFDFDSIDRIETTDRTVLADQPQVKVYYTFKYRGLKDRYARLRCVEVIKANVEYFEGIDLIEGGGYKRFLFSRMVGSPVISIA